MDALRGAHWNPIPARCRALIQPCAYLLSSTRERRFRDWRRDNLSSEVGWLTLRYGWRDAVVEPCETAGNLVSCVTSARL